MASCRSDRVHISERIDLMAKVSVIGFVTPALDPRNAGANVGGGEDDDVNIAAVVGICAARAAESKGDGVGGAPLLGLHVRDAVEGKGGVKGNGALQKRARTDNY